MIVYDFDAINMMMMIVIIIIIIYTGR